ncbi:hypothetical protein ACIP4S_32605 [Streptomyces chartreusis]|uniref:hypothetical protein n=1 Tax=Streptomyces chartreusis TaxID=1969 RepID=UPI003827F927
MQFDAAQRLTELMADPDGETGRVATKLAQLREIHDEIGMAIGAVTVEGPALVAVSASEAARRLGSWLDALEWELELTQQETGRPTKHRREQLAKRRQSVAEQLGIFSSLCRSALHPRENRLGRFAVLKRRRIERSVRVVTDQQDAPSMHDE